GAERFLGQPTRMMLRSLERRPLRALLSMTAIAFAAAILMIGRYQQNAIDHMIGMQFNLVQRDDMTVSFTDPMPNRARHELQGLSGVKWVEPLRTVAAEIRSAHRSYRLAIQGI